jgi:CBS domain-containing protein
MTRDVVEVPPTAETTRVAFDQMAGRGIRRVIVVGKDGDAIGYASLLDLRLDPADVGDVLETIRDATPSAV